MRKILGGALMLFALTLAGCSVDRTEDGVDVDVDTVDLDVPPVDVDVGRDTVVVPDVDIDVGEEGTDTTSA